MAQSPYQLLDQFGSRAGVSVRASGGAKTLEYRQPGITVRITVPDEVLEWFVDVLDGAATVVVQDWSDYDGYSSPSRERCAELMASDIVEFISNLLSRDIRMTVAKERTLFGVLVSRLLKKEVGPLKEKQILEWMNNGSWERAIPFP